MKLTIGYLSGVLRAQRMIDDVIPVISDRSGLLQEVEARVKTLNTDECKQLMVGLLCLKDFSRAIDLSEFCYHPGGSDDV